MKDYGLLFAKGMAMGAADIVPGVSGGTVAFITNIYDELLNSIRSVRPSTLVLLYKEGPAACWRAINGNFLLVLLAGIVTSLLTLSRLISYQLEHNPILLAALFFGLILASILYMLRQLGHIGVREVLAILVGAAAIVLLPEKPFALGTGTWWVFGAGALAICAMILPGISGSFILLMLGVYPIVLGALMEFDLELLAVFIGGCVVGLLSFSHLLGLLLQKARSITLAVLTGFLLGSLKIIWPWKEVLAYRTDRHGESVPLISANVSPDQYQAVVGADPQTLLAILCLVFGFSLVFGIDKLAHRGRI